MSRRERLWVKVWCKEESDSLTLSEKGGWVELLKLAKMSPIPGEIFSVKGIGLPMKALTKVFSCSPKTARSVLRKLALVGRISLDNEGVITITNWSQYQTDSDRTGKYRNVVANATSNATPLEVERDIDIEVDTKATPLLQQLASLPGWEIKDDDSLWLAELCEEYPHFNVGNLRACRDYHKNNTGTKGGVNWKNRLRNWMVKEDEIKSKSKERTVRRDYA